MAKIKSFIEINGKRYDALTGVSVLASGAPVKAPKASVTAAKVSVIKPKDSKASKAKATPRKSGRSVTAHAPARARTLMRRAVAKPAADSKRRFKAVAFIDSVMPQPSFNLTVKPSVLSLDDKRLKHAQQISKSRAISRFSQSQAVVLAVKTTPSPAPQPPTYHAPVTKIKKPKTTADILELALQQATGHLQPPVEPAHRRRLWHRRATATH